MTGKVFLASYACLGASALIFLHFIRIRLKKYHPDLFARLGRPASQDSNIGHYAWMFQKFVWWGYVFEVNDSVTRWLCVFASVSQFGVLILFFLDIVRQLKLFMND
jgi:hypothetical protein